MSGNFDDKYDIKNHVDYQKFLATTISRAKCKSMVQKALTGQYCKKMSEYKINEHPDYPKLASEITKSNNKYYDSIKKYNQEIAKLNQTVSELTTKINNIPLVNTNGELGNNHSLIQTSPFIPFENLKGKTIHHNKNTKCNIPVKYAEFPSDL
jgi:hypothetical protein